MAIRASELKEGYFQEGRKRKGGLGVDISLTRIAGEAAREAGGTLLVGVDFDQFFQAPPFADLWLTSVRKRYDIAVKNVVRLVVNGTFEGGGTFDGSVDPRPLLADVILTGIPCDWSPDGSSILASSAGVLHFVTLDGASSPLAGDGIGRYAMGGLWSPDGSHVLFSMALEDDRFDVYTAAADGSELTPIADSDLLEESAYWLP